MSTTKERPILIKAEMVRAILEGRKTQTRRIVKRHRDMEFDVNDPTYGPYWLSYATEADGEDAKVRCPYGKPSDRLWVRERYMKARCPIAMSGAAQVTRGPAIEKNWQHCAWYEDSEDPLSWPIREGWKSPIFMPRWASRITLEITAVRVERLNAISESDAMAEGVIEDFRPPLDSMGLCSNYRVAYRDLWQSLHGPGSWDDNPWVWVVEFRRVQP